MIGFRTFPHVPHDVRKVLIAMKNALTRGLSKERAERAERAAGDPEVFTLKMNWMTGVKTDELLLAILKELRAMLADLRRIAGETEAKPKSAVSVAALSEVNGRVTTTDESTVAPALSDDERRAAQQNKKQMSPAFRLDDAVRVSDAVLRNFGVRR
jgi:hypothetical protein